MDRWLTRLNPHLRISSRCPAWGLAPKINDVLRWVSKLVNQRSIFVYLSKVEWTWRHIIFFHHHNKITYFIIKLVFYRQIAEKKVLSTTSMSEKKSNSKQFPVSVVSNSQPMYWKTTAFSNDIMSIKDMWWVVKLC